MHSYEFKTRVEQSNVFFFKVWILVPSVLQIRQFLLTVPPEILIGWEQFQIHTEMQEK